MPTALVLGKKAVARMAAENGKAGKGRTPAEDEMEMKKPKATNMTRVGMPEREANRQLLWTVGWTFTFLLMSIYFLQGA